MQKAALLFVLLAVVALAVAEEEPQPPEAPKAPAMVNYRVARQIPMRMPSIDEIKAAGQEWISKLPPQVQEYAQEYANKAQEVAQKFMPA